MSSFHIPACVTIILLCPSRTSRCSPSFEGVFAEVTARPFFFFFRLSLLSFVSNGWKEKEQFHLFIYFWWGGGGAALPRSRQIIEAGPPG